MNVSQFIHYKVSLFSMTGIFILVFITSWSIQLVLGDPQLQFQADFTCYTPDQLYNDNGTTLQGGNIYCP